MSDQYNDTWLEAAKQNFEAAADDGNWDMARAVIEDLKEQGFEKEAVVLERNLSFFLNDL